MKNIIISTAVISMMIITVPREAGTATLSYSIGDVKVQRTSVRETGRPGMTINTGDTVITGERSLAIISFSRGSMVKMRQNTRLKVTGEIEAGRESPALFLQSGSVFSKILKREPGESYRIQTKTIVASVRGTEFFFSFGKGENSSRDLWLCVNSGKVLVSDLAGKEAPVTVAEGQGILITKGTGITPPREYPWTKNLNWNMDPDRGSVIDDTDLNSAYTDLLNQDYD